MSSVHFSESSMPDFITNGRSVEDMLQEQVGWEQVSSLVCDDIANLYQTMGFHGFKRMERFESREEAEEARCLRKLIYDVATVRTTVDLVYSALPASATLKGIMMWKKEWYEANLKRLISIMTVAMGTGKFQYTCWLQKAIKCQQCKLKDLIKAMQGIEIAGWDNGHHLMVLNKWVHRKYKAKEKKIQGRQID